MTTPSPQITTVIPTYRRPQMLRRAIRSVLNQTYPNFRVAVFDNASGDETASVVAELMQQDSRITYHCHPENIGMVNNFNYAFQHVETPFFSLLSDDDLLLPEYYETVLSGFDRYPDAMLSSSTSIGMMSTERGASLAGRMPREGYFAPPEGLLHWTLYNHPVITCTLFRREVIERYGIMNDELTSDVEMELRIVAQAPCVISFKPCVLIMSHDSNATNLAKPEVWWRGYQSILRSLDLIPTIPADVLAQVKQNLHQDFAHHTYLLGLRSLVRRNFVYGKAAIDSLRECYHDERQAAALERMYRIQDTVQRSIWPMRACVDAAYHIRKAINYQLKFRRLEEQYRGYVHDMAR